MALAGTSAVPQEVGDGKTGLPMLPWRVHRQLYPYVRDIADETLLAHVACANFWSLLRSLQMQEYSPMCVAYHSGFTGILDQRC